MCDALVVWSDERAPYNLIIVLICVECGAEECGANFHAVENNQRTSANNGEKAGDIYSNFVL